MEQLWIVEIRLCPFIEVDTDGDLNFHYFKPFRQMVVFRGFEALFSGALFSEALFSGALFSAYESNQWQNIWLSNLAYNQHFHSQKNVNWRTPGEKKSIRFKEDEHFLIYCLKKISVRCTEIDVIWNIERVNGICQEI